MPDEFFTRPNLAPGLPPRRSGASLRVVIALSLLAFVGGAVLVGYLVWNGKVELDGKSPAPIAVSSAPAPRPAGANPAPVLDQRMAALEQRLTQITLAADAAEAKTSRAEALLIVAAARRDIDAGQPLGPLADQLRTHFAASQSGAVQTVIAGGMAPITLDQLLAELDALAPRLSADSADQNGWDRFRRDLGSLFVIRRDAAPAVRAETRLDHARLLLRGGAVDAALREVESLSPGPQAAEWLGKARRYGALHAALDQLDAAALAAPVSPAAPPRPGT